MPAIEYIESLLVYENPRPHVHSRHGCFPHLTSLPSGDLLALFVIAEAFESPDGTTWISRSKDQGRTWQLQGRLYDKTVVGFETTDAMKATVLRDGSLIALGYRFHRHDLESPIAIPETGGILPGDDLVSFSRDQGRTWSVPSIIARPYPELLEISGPCIELRSSGHLAAVAALYPLPDGSNPSGRLGLFLRSRDRGRTWTCDATYYRHPALPITPYEPRIVEMQDGRLVAIVWAYDGVNGIHYPNQAVVSHDEGATWSAPIDTGHPGQASSLTWLGGDVLLTIHAQRQKNPGVWVRLVDFRHDQWKPLAETVIYGSSQGPQTASGQSAADMFKSLKFGQPSLLHLGGGEILATHWCIEDGQGRIRSHRLRLKL